MFLGLVHAAVLGAALRVEGEVSCPAPAQVAADVQKILGLSDEYAPKVHATLTREGAFIRLSLSESDGTSLGERLLTADEDCTVLSRAAAVVLAAWLTDQHPEFLVALPAAADASTPGGAARETGTTPQSMPGAAPVHAAAPAKSDAAQLHTSAAAPAAAVTHPHRLALGAALGGGWANSQFVPGAWLGVSLDPLQSGWGAQLSAAWLGSHTQPLHGHSVSWSRWPLMLGPYLRFATKFGSVELEAGPALGWLHLKGQEFAPNYAPSKAQVGGYGALRFMPRANAWHPFLMVAPVLWFNSVTAQSVDALRNETDSTHLSSLEVLFTAGVRFLP